MSEKVGKFLDMLNSLDNAPQPIGVKNCVQIPVIRRGGTAIVMVAAARKTTEWLPFFAVVIDYDRSTVLPDALKFTEADAQVILRRLDE